jgi:TonB family protein
MSMKRSVLPALLFLITFGFSSILAQTQTSEPVDSGVLNGKAILLPAPKFPGPLGPGDASGLAGPIMIKVTVDESGNVISAFAVSGHPLLRAACIAAAKEAKFKPMPISGRPVKFSGTIVYNFVPDTPDLDVSANLKYKNRIISKGILNGKTISMPKPERPSFECAVRAGGLACVQIVVAENGDVISAKAVSGDSILRAAAEDAARKAKFSPLHIDGPPVEVSGILIYDFGKVDKEKASPSRAHGIAPRIVHVGVISGKPLCLPKPAYPSTAAAVNVSGAVQVEVVIDETGNVILTKVISGHSLLRASAVAAAKLAKFKPLTISGHPVQVSSVIVYNFTSGTNSSN